MRKRNWREYSAPQAHDQEVLIVPSCIEDEGRPFEVRFQEQTSNHSKLLQSKAVGSEHLRQSVERSEVDPKN